MNEIKQALVTSTFPVFKVKFAGEWWDLSPTKTAAAVAEREPVAQFRKVGCSDWYDGLPDHQDGRGPYEKRTLYLDPPPTSELDALRKERDDLIHERAAAVGEALRIRDEANRRAETAETRVTELDKGLVEIVGMRTELKTSHDYSRGWNDALFRVRQIARRVLEGGKVDG